MRKSAVRLEKLKLGTGRTVYQLYANLGGQRFRERFGCEAEALGRQQELRRKEEEHLSYPPMMPTNLTRTQLADEEIALEHLNERFPNRSLSWAVTALCDLDPEKPSVPLADAVANFLAMKKPVVNRKSGRDYESTLNRYLKAVGNLKVHETKHEHVTRYFKELTAEIDKRHHKRNRPPKKFTQPAVSNGTYNHHLARLNTFYIWFAKSYPDARQPKRNPCDGTPKRAASEMTREILLPKEAAELLKLAERWEGGRLVNYIAFALFAGVRPDVEGELGKLAQKPPETYLDWKHSLIRLPASLTKTNRAREIDIQPALEAFLSAYPLDEYTLQPATRRSERSRTEQQVLRNSLERFRAACKVHLAHDILRHSYISYHLRLTGEYAETARQAGNTEDIIRRHYQRRVTREETEAFWRIRPIEQPQ